MQSFEEILQNVSYEVKRYNKLCEMLTYEEILLDKKLFLNIKKQTEILKPLAEIYNNFCKETENLKLITDFVNNSNEEDKLLFEKEINIAKENLNLLEENLKKTYVLLLANLENIVVEIVQNKGELSSKCQEILVTGYENFCKQNGFNFTITNASNGSKISISGVGVNSYFKEEIGLHNAVLGAKNGSCSVFVYEKVNNEVYSFSENELKITTTRSSGAGGQHINKTDSAIKITHLPTGITAISQDERSQFQNKQIALERIKNKVVQEQVKKETETIKTQKKQQLKKMKTLTKTYYLDSGNILKENPKKQILLDSFLSGKILN